VIKHRGIICGEFGFGQCGGSGRIARYASKTRQGDVEMPETNDGNNNSRGPKNIVGRIIKRVAGRVRRRRDRLGFTQDDLAARAKASRSEVQNIESGKMKSGPSIELLDKVARALGTSAEELLRDQPGKDRDPDEEENEEAGDARRLRVFDRLEVWSEFNI